MKLSFGRKFYTCLIVELILSAMFFITLAVYPIAITPAVMVAYAGFALTLGFCYIGGNVWKSWVKSKYFQSELLRK